MFFEFFFIAASTATTYISGFSMMSDDQKIDTIAEWIVYIGASILLYFLYSVLKSYATRIPLWCFFFMIQAFLIVNIVGWCNARDDKCTEFPSKSMDMVTNMAIYTRDVVLPSTKDYFMSIVTTILRNYNSTNTDK